MSARAAASNQPVPRPNRNFQHFSTEPYIMILRPLPITLLLLPALIAAQDDPFDCQKHLSIQSLKFDLSKLAGEHTVSRTRDTPPTTVVDDLRFNVCADLKTLDGVAEVDQVRLHHMKVLHTLIARTVSEGDESMSHTNKQEGKRGRPHSICNPYRPVIHPQTRLLCLVMYVTPVLHTDTL